MPTSSFRKASRWKRPLQPGDLVFFGELSAEDDLPGPDSRGYVRKARITHVGISLGGEEFIHANGTDWGVSINSFAPPARAMAAGWPKTTARQAVSMKLTASPLTLTLKTTFRVSHERQRPAPQRAGTHSARRPDRLRRGRCRAILRRYAGKPAGLAERPAAAGRRPLRAGNHPERAPPARPAARAAVDIALHDLWGKQLGQPLYRLFGLSPAPLPPTSFTLARTAPK